MVYYSKRNRRKRNNRRVLTLFIIGMMLYFSFNLGRAKSQGNLNYCNYELQEAMKSVSDMEKKQVQFQKDIEKLHIEKNIVLDKYNRLAESDDLLMFFKNVKTKMKSGVELKRIERVVRDLKSDRKCSKAINKRFIVKTPLYKGDIKNTNVSFEKGVFDITADGYSFINENKKPESWFDVKKPLVVSFNAKNGTEVIKEALPIKKSIVLDNKEYFFEIELSKSKGFVNILEYNCNYP